MEKFCQSCGMPLKEENLGTEKNGENSLKYCSYCYQDGEFIEPNMTYDEMLKRSLLGIEKNNKGLGKWFLKKFYPSQLKKLERWK